MSERRYEIGVLFGPCTEDEAAKLMEDVADLVIGRLGAVVSMGPTSQADDELWKRDRFEEEPGAAA